MPPSLPARAVLGAIRLYKLTLSPFVGRECRYLPTCSAYAADAVRAHGAWAGSWMAAARLCRCHPWGGSGYDPAPAQAAAPWWAPWRFGDWGWKHLSPERGRGRASAASEGEGESRRIERDANAAPISAPRPLIRRFAPPSPPRGGEGQNNESSEEKT